MSDGETPEAALANVEDAIATWIEAGEDVGHAVPEPSSDVMSSLGRGSRAA